MDNQAERLRCTRCGKVDVPRAMPIGPAWLALALWALATVVWAAGFLLSIPSVLFLGLALLLPAMIYTLWYFFRREQACRHCGGRELEPEEVG